MPDEAAGKQRGRPFKKGQSGNPNGRPKGSVSLLGAIKARLKEHPEELEEIAQNLIDLGRSGDHKAIASIRTLLERLDGPVPTVLEGSDDRPVTVTIRRSGQPKE